MNVKTIGILGAGIMGSDVAQCAASKGFKVVLRDIDIKFCDNAMAKMTKSLQKRVEKGKLEQGAMDGILANISTTADMKDLAGCDFIIEAIVENLQIKQDTFAELNAICGPETIFCSNTSSMSITSIASKSGRPEKVVGMHFFNPATVMKLVEVIKGYNTSDETLNTVREVAAALGKTSVDVKTDTPGFIVNRCLFPFMLEAIHCYEEGVASKEDIDTAIKLGLNHPMGPFEMMDLSGLDTFIPVTEYFFSQTKDSKWNAPGAIRQVINAGRYGRKNGHGWYDYE